MTYSKHIIIRYSIGWFGMMILAIINGSIRQFFYRPFVGDLTAHQISTVTLIVVIGWYLGWLLRRWQLQSDTQAFVVGGIWLAMTLAFEFLAGHYLFGSSWEKLLADYNLAAGRVWVFIPLWIVIAPFVIRRIFLSSPSRHSPGE
jgi:hypothetical protein